MTRKGLSLGTMALAAFLLCGCNDVSTELKPPTYKTGINPDNISMSAFKEQFPNQYETYMWNNRD